jgi:hypothetical protein
VNHLLVVGFYLVNLGYVSLALRTNEAVASPESAIEALSWKMGLVLLVLGGMHFMNLIVFAKCRRRALDEAADAAYRAARSGSGSPPAPPAPPAPVAAPGADALPRLANLWTPEMKPSEPRP